MEAIVSPLRRLGEDAAWFVRDDALDVLRVRCAERSRGDVLRTLLTYEQHGDNRATFVLLEDAHLADDPGWTTRALRLLEAAGAKTSSVGSLQGPPAFVSAAKHVDASWDPPRRGTVIILAPAILESVETYVEALERLLGTLQKSGIRFVLVDDTPEVDALAQTRGMRGSAVRSGSTTRRCTASSPIPSPAVVPPPRGLLRRWPTEPLGPGGDAAASHRRARDGRRGRGNRHA